MVTLGWRLRSPADMRLSIHPPKNAAIREALESRLHDLRRKQALS
jgi:hypothetical protein